MSVRFSTRFVRTSEDNTKNGLGEDFWNILAQDFIIGLSCRMLVAKHACLCQCNANMSRDNDKMLQFRVQMFDTHGNDAFMKHMIAMPVK